KLPLVSFVQLRTPTGDDDLYLPEHGDLLVDAIERARPSLLVIDPLEALLGAKVDSRNAPSMRHALRAVSVAAKRAGCAGLVVPSLNRKPGATRFVDRAAESMAAPRAARSALLLCRDPDDPEGRNGVRRVLALGKTNLARPPRARVYTIEPCVLPYVAAAP